MPKETSTSNQVSPDPNPAPSGKTPTPLNSSQPSQSTQQEPGSQPSISQVAAAKLQVNSPGVIVLQWLTYAFWGWTVLALSALMGAVFATFIANANTSTLTTYAMAAVLVLLPLSLVCDIFYSKYEPTKKTGAATIVMVIHAVIFALFGIGSLIVAVFSVVQMLTSYVDSSVTQVALYTALVTFVIYLAVFLRTLNLEQFPWLRKFFIIFMLITAGIIGVLGIIGPVAYERATRDDRLIVENIHEIKQEIDEYAQTNKKLPDQLSQITPAGKAQELIERDLVKYTPNTLNSTTSTRTNNTKNLDILYEGKTTFYYTLCVDYKKPTSKDNSPNALIDYGTDKSGYSTYISAYDHPAGEVCYKVKTSEYYY